MDPFVAAHARLRAAALCSVYRPNGGNALSLRAFGAAPTPITAAWRAIGRGRGARMPSGWKRAVIARAHVGAAPTPPALNFD